MLTSTYLLVRYIEKLRKEPGIIIQECLKYKTHVVRQVYTSDPAEVEANMERYENIWPEYKESLHLTNLPSYLHSTSRAYVPDQTEDNQTAS